MLTAKELREARGKKIAEMRAMVAKAKAEKREFTAEEETQYDALKVEVDEFQPKITRAEQIEQMEARAAVENNKPAKGQGTPGPSGGEKREKEEIKKRYSITKAIYRSSQNLPLEGIEKEMHEEALTEARARKVTITGIGVPSMLVEERADLIAGQDAQGGATIATDTTGFLPILRPRLKVQEMGATVLSGLIGNIRIPKQDGASTAAWGDETHEIVNSDATFTSLGLSPKRLGAASKFSKQILTQSTISIDRFVTSDIEKAIRISVDLAAINGSGIGNEPLGILNTPGINAVVSGGTVDFEKIVALETAIAAENADIGAMHYLTTPGMRGKLKTTKIDAGSGQFVWNNNQLNGYSAHATTQMPKNLGGAGHGVLFGDFSQLIMANWAGMDLVVNPYTYSKQAMVEVVANTWWDMVVRYAQAFAAITDGTV